MERPVPKIRKCRVILQRIDPILEYFWQKANAEHCDVERNTSLYGKKWKDENENVLGDIAEPTKKVKVEVDEEEIKEEETPDNYMRLAVKQEMKFGMLETGSDKCDISKDRLFLEDRKQTNLVINRSIIENHQKKILFKHPQLLFCTDALLISEEFRDFDAIICSICGRLFSSERNYEIHLARLLGQGEIQHPQDSFHFVEELGGQTTAPLPSPLVQLLKEKNDRWKVAECDTTTTNPSPNTTKDTVAKESTNKSVECQICLLVFADVKSAVVHIGRHHCFQSPYMYCSDCGLVLLDHESYVKHAENFHPERMNEAIETLPCHCCPAHFTKGKEYRRHLKLVHDDPFTCSHCSESFLSFASLAHHKGLHKDSFHFYACPVCGQLVTSHLGDHILEAHAEMLPSQGGDDETEKQMPNLKPDFHHAKCGLCDFKVAFSSNRKRRRDFCDHREQGQCRGVSVEESSNGSVWRVWTCKPCQTSLTSFYDFRLHMSVYHTDKYFSAEGYVIAQKSIWWPQGRERKGCEHCGAQCADMASHMIHIHQGVGGHGRANPSKAGQRVVQGGNLKHGKKKSPSKQASQKLSPKAVRYNCQKCPKSFASKQGLNKHISGVHSTKKMSTSPKKEEITSPLKQWLISGGKKKDTDKNHSHANSVQCSVCSQKFDDHKEMCEPEKVHKSEQTGFRCLVENCGKVFTYKSTLTRHLDVHFDPHIKKCQWCSAQYSQTYPLRKHVQKMHSQHFKEYLHQDRRRADKKSAFTKWWNSVKNSP